MKDYWYKNIINIFIVRIDKGLNLWPIQSLLEFFQRKAIEG